MSLFTSGQQGIIYKFSSYRGNSGSSSRGSRRDHPDNAVQSGSESNPALRRTRRTGLQGGPARTPGRLRILDSVPWNRTRIPGRPKPVSTTDPAWARGGCHRGACDVMLGPGPGPIRVGVQHPGGGPGRHRAAVDQRSNKLVEWWETGKRLTADHWSTSGQMTGQTGLMTG